MLKAVIVASAFVVLLLGLAWVSQRNLIYLPSAAPVPRAESVIPSARDVLLHTSDGLELGAWFVPAHEPDRRLVVLVANGNAGNRAVRAPLAEALARDGLSVLLFDYRGYGGNPGSPTEVGLRRDIRAARSFLVDDMGVSANRLIYFGESLGTALVVELASEHPPAGIVLRSPFVDLAALGEVHYPFLPVRLLLRDRYPLVSHLAAVTVPVTVVYGGRDSIVPPDQSRAVAAAASTLSRVVEVPGADHNDPELLDGELLVGAVVDLADNIDRSH